MVGCEMAISVMTFDQLSGIATIALAEPARESVLTYTDSTQRITAPARGAIDFPNMSLVYEMHEACRDWAAWLPRTFAISSERRMFFEEMIAKRPAPFPGQISFSYVVNGTRIAGDWNKRADKISFKPRQAMDWNLVDFDHFLQLLSRVFREIKTF